MIFLAKKFHEGSFHSVHVKCQLQQLIIIINYDLLDKIFAGSNLRTEVGFFKVISQDRERLGCGEKGRGGGVNKLTA